MSLWRVFPGRFSLGCCGRPVTCKCKTIFDSSITYSRLVSCRKLHHGRPAPPKLIFNPKQVCSSTSFSVLPLVYRDKCTFSHRTHNCGSITASNIGERVRLCGWLHKHRNSGLFLLLRDWSGVIQVITNEEVLNSLGKLTHEMVLEVEGTVQARLDGQDNKDMATGEIEIIADRLRTLNTCTSKLPIDVNKKYIQSKESLRMEYRYLDIRGNMMQHNLRLRSQIIMKMREFLCNQHGFVDVETPTLFRKTPGGAKEFVVPSRQPGKFYSLPQSPQQFKQLLMVGGLDRYFQIAKCYRDEGSKPDRQPEFTQVDIELSFTTQKYVQEMIEQLLKYCWPEDKGQITRPFPQMTYDEAMTQYGVDKPDTRFEMKLTDVSDIMRGCGIQNLESDLCQENGSVICVKIPNGDNLLSNKEVSKLKRTPYEDLQVKMADLKQTKDGVWKYSTSLRLTDDTKQKLVERLAVEPADVVYLASGQGYDPHKALGRLRCDAVDFIESKGTILRNPDVFNFLWVTDFPLFLPKEDGDGLESAHHPFTAPHPDDEHLLYTAPERIRSQHYDLVLNGNEIGGGSIRIHNSDVQKYVLEKILQEDSSQLNHLLEALSYGCPPHGGIALGLDRLLAIICQAESIRDVIAFPKSVDGRDIMSQAPANVSAEDLAEYHISVMQS